MERLIFVRVAWMKNYQGEDDDIPVGVVSNGDENEKNREVFSFLPMTTRKDSTPRYFPWFALQKSKSINLGNLGVVSTSKVVSPVTVVMFAAHPTTGLNCIVGWYTKATLHSMMQKAIDPEGKEFEYRAVAEVAHSKLLSPAQRTFTLTGPGQSNVWFGPDSKDDITMIGNYINQWMKK